MTSRSPRAVFCSAQKLTYFRAIDECPREACARAGVAELREHFLKLTARSRRSDARHRLSVHRWQYKRWSVKISRAEVWKRGEIRPRRWVSPCDALHASCFAAPRLNGPAGECKKRTGAAVYLLIRCRRSELSQAQGAQCGSVSPRSKLPFSIHRNCAQVLAWPRFLFFSLLSSSSSTRYGSWTPSCCNASGCGPVGAGSAPCVTPPLHQSQPASSTFPSASANRERGVGVSER